MKIPLSKPHPFATAPGHQGPGARGPETRCHSLRLRPRLDCLSRSTRDLLNTLAAITEKKAGFRSLGDSSADTTTAHGRLILTVLRGLAEGELIRAHK